MIQIMVAVFLFIIGLCFGSFALATAWRIKKKKDFVRDTSECEHCHHKLVAKDLVPLLSWLSLRGKCRYCHIKISGLLPVAELTGAAVFTMSYLYWPVNLTGALVTARFFVWCAVLVLLLILFFYDLQWFILPNKIVYPLWALALLDFTLRFIQLSNWTTILSGLLSIFVAAGIFWLFWVVSKGTWIGYGDVRLGLAIGLLVGSPIMAGLVLFMASVAGILFALPSLVIGSRKLTSKVPFGPLLIIGLIMTTLFGQGLIDWYMHSILLLS